MFEKKIKLEIKNDQLKKKTFLDKLSNLRKFKGGTNRGVAFISVHSNRRGSFSRFFVEKYEKTLKEFTSISLYYQKDTRKVVLSFDNSGSVCLYKSKSGGVGFSLRSFFREFEIDEGINKSALKLPTTYEEVPGEGIYVTFRLLPKNKVNN